MNYYYRLTKTNDNKLSKRGIKIPAVIKENINDLKNCSEEEKELSNKEVIEYLLKNAVKTINNIDEKKLDTMRVLDKIRAGIPMRLKSWIKTMFIIYQYNQLFIINEDNIMEIDNISILLEHEDSEWEEYDIPEKYEKVITKESYEYFIQNIYEPLMESYNTSTIEDSTLYHMKVMLEKRI